MAICVLDSRTPRTVVRTGNCIATFCFASSQMITWTNCKRRSSNNPSGTDLVLREFRLLATSNDSNEIGFSKHLHGPYPGVEIYLVQHAVGWLRAGHLPRETRSWHGSELNTGRNVSRHSRVDLESRCILQKPVSRPTAKQLASWLKEADKATGLLEVSITGLVFMVLAGLGTEARSMFEGIQVLGALLSSAHIWCALSQSRWSRDTEP
jgi:hypothetical protein